VTCSWPGEGAVTGFRRHWWGLLAGRPEGFPWLRVAGRELTGITVVDLDAAATHDADELSLETTPGLRTEIHVDFSIREQSWANRSDRAEWVICCECLGFIAGTIKRVVGALRL
jgi:hypothetical protein